MDDLVTTKWLADHLRDVVPVDCSWFMPASGRSGREDYLERHIAGARFLDIDAVADETAGLPHALPSPDAFSRAMSQIGIGRDDRIVVYDNSPLHTAARGWFMFRHYGAERVAILDGGLGKWLAEGRPVESGEAPPRRTRFEAIDRSAEVVTKAQVSAGLDTPLIDARGRGRFEGTEPDPRPGVASGHMPGARNLPFGELYNEDGTFKSRDEIRRLFEAAGIDPERPFVATCGSGVTANSLLFAAHLLGNRHGRLYDGSWSEYGADPSTPKAIGPA